MNYIQIVIEATEEQQDILISQLSDLDAHGFEQTNETLIACFNQHSFKSHEVNEVLKDQLYEISVVAEQNWNQLWESNFQPVVVNNFCAVRAEFHQTITNVEHEIIITPKMSFGTGHHATTYMMIEQMRGIDFNNRTVLDFGTGTGILAILAEKLGAECITAIDEDTWSIENAIENLKKNYCKKIKLYQGSKVPENKFDIILANINLHVVCENVVQIVQSINPHGQLLISGILKNDEKNLGEVFKLHDFHLVEKLASSEWSCMLLKRQ